MLFRHLTKDLKVKRDLRLDRCAVTNMAEAYLERVPVAIVTRLRLLRLGVLRNHEPFPPRLVFATVAGHVTAVEAGVC